MYKICLIGDANVGKTSLVSRFIHGAFRGSYKATLGTDIFRKEITLPTTGSEPSPPNKVVLQIWDLAGHEHFVHMRAKFYNGTDGILCVFDISKKKSFDNIHSWLKEAANSISADKPPKIIVVGNKIDLDDQKEITKSMMETFSSETAIEIVLVSAKNGSNVDEVFYKLTHLILKS